jgi:hypothetical protein
VLHDASKWTAFPDGDLVRRLRQSGASKPFEGWPCYHTELDTFELGGHRVGIVVDAVSLNRSAMTIFPANREKNRELVRF